MSPITTHVLDTAAGRPAAGIAITLERRGDDGAFTRIGQGHTDADGRLKTLIADAATFTAGVYRITFATGPYFDSKGLHTFYPEVSVLFDIKDPAQHYHVPLLISPFGFSTYRGS